MRTQNRVVCPLLALIGALAIVARGWTSASMPIAASDDSPVAVSVPTADTAPEDWPNWGGPAHDLNLREGSVSTEWPKDGLPVKWTREIGIGFSSMSVVGGRMMAIGHVDGNEHVWCLDADSGDVHWKHTYPCRLIDNLHEGGPCSTPTIDGDLVYTLGKEGQLFCLKMADGSVVWQKDLQQDLGVKLPEWGFSSSARILGKQLILESGRVVSYDKTNGVKLWQTELHDAGYGSVATLDDQGRTLLATLDCNGLRIVNSADGTEVAFKEWKSPYQTNSTTPIIIGDTIFISTGYKVGCGMFRFRNDSLEPIYVNHEMRNHFSNSVLQDGHFYGFDGDSHSSRNVMLTCLEAGTGKSVWKQRGLGCGSLMIVDGRLLV
ncbi:MAG: PQQ-binding-like beta-propeller repeat protein, partial [Fuerstia sp.]|nr:PQQ-binding-like beta-propeller repeat protein [Fuerstiella sp.]